MFLSNEPIFLLGLLGIMSYSAYTDFRFRTMWTGVFLYIDIVLFAFYLYFDTIFAFFIVPIILEYFIKGKESFIPYALILIPLIHDPGVVTVSIFLSIIIVKGGSAFLRIGVGDIKMLEMIAIAIPVYPNLPLVYSIFSPMLLILFIASFLSTLSFVILKITKWRGVKGWPRRFASGEVMEGERHKYWINGRTASYKVPLVLFITIAYGIFVLLTIALL